MIGQFWFDDNEVDQRNPQGVELLVFWGGMTYHPTTMTPPHDEGIKSFTLVKYHGFLEFLEFCSCQNYHGITKFVYMFLHGYPIISGNCLHGLCSLKLSVSSPLRNKPCVLRESHPFLGCVYSLFVFFGDCKPSILCTLNHQYNQPELSM